jgi:hypothetical protein
MRRVAGRRPRPEDSTSLATSESPLAASARFKPALDFLTALAALTIPYVAIRVLIEAHFNLDVAVALAVATDPLRLVLSTLLLLVPSLFAAGGFACAFHGGRKASKVGKAKIKALWPWLAAALALSVPFQLAGLAGEWKTVLLYLVLLVLAVGVGWHIDARVPEWPSRADAEAHAMRETVVAGRPRVIYRVAAVAFGLLLVLDAIAGPMWLPAERVLIDEKPNLVYFLNVEDDEAVLYVPDRNAVQRYALEDLSERQFCRVDNFETFAEAIFGGPEGLPACPK